MKDSRRNQIIDDLLTLQPKGEAGENPTYTVEEYWCYDAHKDKKRTDCNHDGWGYRPETLFQLDLLDEERVRRHVLDRFYEGKTDFDLRRGMKAGVTRKVNRIWGRIGGSVRKILNEGRPGVYRLQQGYYSEILGTVYAQDHDDAQKLGTLFYGYLMEEDSSKLRSIFVRMGGMEVIQAVNEKAIVQIQRNIKNAEEKIETGHQKIKKCEMQVEAIRMLQLHTLSQMVDGESA